MTLFRAYEAHILLIALSAAGVALFLGIECVIWAAQAAVEVRR